MKKIYFFVTAVAMFFATTASAQFVNQGGGRSKSSADVESVFNTLELTYSPVNLKVSYDNSSSTDDLNAFSLKWMQARALTSALPLYIQYGVGVQFAWMTDSEDYYDESVKVTTSFLTAKIPVNVMYCWNIPSTNIALMPYVGLNLHGHILGQEKYTVSYEGESESETINLFSKDDMGEDEVFNRFVAGWQIGAKVAFGRYFVGVDYEGPVSNLYKEGDFKINTNQVNISLGIKF